VINNDLFILELFIILSDRHIIWGRAHYHDLVLSFEQRTPHPFARAAAFLPAMRPKTAPDIRPVLLAWLLQTSPPTTSPAA
jgi:hypothetical protein